MNKNRPWNRDNRDRNMRGGFRGGRGGNRGWSGNHRGFKSKWGSFDGPSGGNKFQNNYSGNKGHWKKRDTPGKRLSEEDIGVTEYISKHEGFNGIIKSRYSDFQVSEISEQGEIAKLTCKKAPQAPEEDAVSEDEDLLLSKYNLEILPMETWDKINTLAVSKEPDPDCVEIDMEGVTKEQRTKIHDAVKKAFGDSIVGSTVNIDDKKLMRFQKFKKGVRIDNRVKWMWPAEYVYFIVHKENCDTMDAAVRIAERIGVHVKPSMLGYAGTKDRRAKTSQWFSARRLDPRRIVQATRYLKDIHVGNFCFKHTNLKLGMLKGNRFRIALRNVTAADELVDTACRHLRDHGFINYYGLQRFGSRVDTPTYNIGLKLLQGNFKEAIDMILEYREGPMEGALQAYKQSGAGAAVKLLPRRTSTYNEARLMRALAEAPNDLLGALGKLARNTRLLYLHSYQSLVWNRGVSERVRRFGLQPAVGDLVPLVVVDKEDEFEDDDDSDSEDDQSDSETKESVKHEVKKEVKVETESLPEVKKEDKVETEKQQQKNEERPKIPVKVLTQEDIDSGKYSILDIVMPLPGYMVDYPPNMKEFYVEELTKVGLTLEMRHKIKSYSMSGAYRHVLIRPRDVSWRCVRYSDPYADLIPSDLDEMHDNKSSGVVEEPASASTPKTISDNGEDTRLRISNTRDAISEVGYIQAKVNMENEVVTLPAAQNQTTISLIEATDRPAGTKHITLPEFDPDTSNLDARAWCAKADLYFSEIPLQGAALINTLSKALKGSALKWLSQVSFAGMTWCDFKGLFLSLYDGVDTPAASLIKLMGSKPQEGESYAAYADRLLTMLTLRWKNMSAEQIATSTVLAHMAQFDERIQRLAFTTDIDSRNKLQCELEALSVNLTEGSQVLKRPKFPLKCHNCGKPGHRASECKDKPTIVTTEASTSAVPKQRSELICFKCGNAGHFASKCSRRNAAKSSSLDAPPKQAVGCEPRGQVSNPSTALETDGKYKALLLNMTLPASCYATMALRELLKVDTSSDNQASQNNYHKERKTSATEQKENGEQKRTDSETDKTKMDTDSSDKEKVETESGEKRKMESGSEEDVKKQKLDE